MQMADLVCDEVGKERGGGKGMKGREGKDDKDYYIFKIWVISKMELCPSVPVVSAYFFVCILS